MKPPFPVFHPAVTTLLVFGILLIRYFAIAGTGWILAWKRPTLLRRLDPIAPDPATVRGEIYWSVASTAIFALGGAFVIHAWELQWVRIYSDPFEYGAGYLVFSLPLLLLLHETYFYWTHRWMHRPALFRGLHRVHHLSIRPTPWASFSFHPYEALVQALVLPLLLLIVPVHWIVLLVFLSIMTVTGMLNHLGYEAYPRWADRWGLVTATHHQEHHQKLSRHFGLYFTFWDHWMGTQK